MSTKDKYLKLEVIWKDEYMFELKVTANNGRYSGITQVYETKEPLLNFANSLNEFPKYDKELIHSCGVKDTNDYFEMKFYQIDPTGKVGVLIILRETLPVENRTEVKSKLEMELIVFPAAIDKFIIELKHLANNEEGEAELFGM